MSGKSKVNKTTNEVLGIKVRIIYTLLCNRDNKRLLELFTNQKKLQENDNYLISRKRVINRYIDGYNVSEKDLREQYNYLTFSRLLINNEPLFSLDEFINSDIKTFTERIKAYGVYETEFDKNYHYIYMYDEEVGCYTIDYSQSTPVPLSENSWSIEVIPPQSKIGIGTYKGSMTFLENRISLTLENSFDHITMLFETSLKHTSSDAVSSNILYGVAIGINDQNQKIPMAKKVILVEAKMSEEELGKYYLILNETERLSADENLYTFEERSLDATYLSKYQKKIENLHTFFSNVKYSPFIKTSLAHHMIFTEFHAFKNMYDRFAQNQDYFLSDRKRVYLEFLRFLKIQNEKEAYIVLPISKKSENIFLYETVGRESIKELVISRANTGVKFTIIFVIQSIRDLEHGSFYASLHQLNEAGIAISFVYKKQIQKGGYSYDFFYAQSHNYVVSYEHLVQNKNFTIIQNRQHIRSYISNFKKIEQESFSYKDLITQKYPCALEHPLLEKIVGEWYCYFYGSFETADHEQMLWETNLSIDRIFHVKETIPNRNVLQGRLTIEENQSLITLFNPETKNSVYMTLNNRAIKSISIVMMYSKQYQKDSDMLNIGIISREKLTTDDAKNILGKSRKLIMKVDPTVQDRVDEFILKNLGHL